MQGNDSKRTNKAISQYSIIKKMLREIFVATGVNRALHELVAVGNNSAGRWICQ
jgi:hypothetical protein